MKNFTELQLLLDLSKSILGLSDINEVLEIAIDKAIEITNAERGIIVLFEKKDKILFKTARNLQKQDLDHPEFEISRTIINKVKKNGKLFFRDNALEDQGLKSSASTMRLNILSVICLPLLHNNEIFGVVYLDNRTIDGVFSVQTCQFAESFSDFISLAAFQALERKRLLNRVSSLEKKLRYQYQFETIIGHHPKIVQILLLLTLFDRHFLNLFETYF